MSNMIRLRSEVEAVCPIWALVVPDWDDKQTWIFSPADDATEAQSLAAQSIIGAFDPSASAYQEWVRKNIMRLHEAVAGVCPIAGVGVPDWEVKDTWKFSQTGDATSQEIIDGQSIIDMFDPGTPALKLWEIQRRRLTASQKLLSDTSEHSLGTRANSQATWMRLNDIAEATSACLQLIADRAGIIMPTTSEIEAKVATTRASLGQNFSYPTASQVADHGLRRIMEDEIMMLIGIVIAAGMADPVE